MKFEPLEIPEVILITPKLFKDGRGCFYESYNKKTFQEAGINEEFIQDNQSTSKWAVVRGLHFQLNPKAQGKLVRVVRGEVFDVAVDIRKNSPTFGKWVSAKLSSKNKQMLYIPAGFAHGFQALRKNTIFCYKCTELYSKESEGSINFNDPDIGIEWPEDFVEYRYNEYKISQKDLDAPSLKDVMGKLNFQYGE